MVFLAVGGVFFASGGDARAVVLPPDLTACVSTEEASPVRAAVRSAAMGERVTFFVEKTYDRTGRSQLTATLRVTGTRSLVYVEDAYYQAQSASAQQTIVSAAAALSGEFDAVIYPGLTAFYGTPWDPGIDGDSRITILLTDLISGAGGYVDTTDMFPRAQAADSNEREMIYLNVSSLSQAQRINSFAAHELTHLIDFYQKKKLRNVDEEVWLNELRAEYAGTRLGYDRPYQTSSLASRVAIFRSNPSDSLTEWKNREADYGSVNLFAQYVSGHYGEGTLAATMQSSRSGIAAIEEALAADGSPDGFGDVFLNWAVANAVNDASAGSRYAYVQEDLRGVGALVASPTTAVGVSPTTTVTLSRQTKDWTGQWITVTPTGSGNTTLIASVTSSVSVSGHAVLRTLDGSVAVVPFEPASGGANAIIRNVTQYRDVTVVASLAGKTSGFSTGDPYGKYPDEALRDYAVSLERTPSDAPLIVNAVPANVLAAGGATVTLEGAGFSTGSVSVTIDGVAVAAEALNDATLRFTAPPHASGAACVRVAVDEKDATHCGVLSYVAYRDGSLLRAEGRPEVWIVHGTFRRHIVSARIFDAYRHLSWDAVEVVPQDVLAQFRLSAWVRLSLTSDPSTWRVFEVNGDGSKHWITCVNPDFCEGTWRARGGDPQGIYTVNQAEIDSYQTGPHVFLQ